MPKAMVVDDSRTIRRILGSILKELGFVVSEAGDGRDALATLVKERESGEAVTLVLVDWNMPEVNGFEFLKLMRSDPLNASVVVMMVTTETQVDQMVAALQAGANEYIMKPFTKDVIREKLRLLGVVQ